MSEEAVTFTVLEDGLYLRSIGAVLPPGEYHGRIERRDGKLVDLLIRLQRQVLDQMGLDRGGATSLSWSIVTDYRSGLIQEDRAGDG